MVAEPVEEMPSISGFEFWGATVVPGKTVKCEITGNILHLTSVAMDESIANDPKQRSVLSVIIDGKQFVLASLREGVCEQIAVDFLFRENKPIKFKVSGKTTLHLVGYLQPLDLGVEDEEIFSDEEDEEDEMCDSDEPEGTEEEESEEEESDEEMEAVEEAGGKKRPADIPVEVAEEKTAKKSKKSIATKPKKAELKPEPKKAAEPEPKEAKSELKKAEVEPAEMEAKQLEEATVENVEKPESKKAVTETKKAEAKKPEQPEAKKVEQSKESKKAEEPKKESKKTEKESKKADESKKTEEPNKDSESKKGSEKKSDPNAFRKLTGGVMVKDGHIGEGKVAAKGKRLGVMYKGMLKSGKVFDSNVDSNKPFFFKMGNGDVIKGWDVGFEGMKVGGKRIIVCPPKMAYGKEGAPPEIPPNSVLVFEVELVNVK